MKDDTRITLLEQSIGRVNSPLSESRKDLIDRNKN